MKRIIALLALVIAALATSTPVASATPLSASERSSVSALPAMQPFRDFNTGEGDGYAVEYINRTKAELAALLRSPEGKLRVSCRTFVAQVAQAHKLALEACEGFAYNLEHDSRYAITACQDEMFEGEGSLTVTNANGTAFGAYHRKCYAGEQVLTYEGVPLVSVMCLNVVIPTKTVARPPATPVLASSPAPVLQTIGRVETKACPTGFSLIVNVWDYKSLSGDILQKVKKLVGAAEGRDSKEGRNLAAYKADDVSRTLGKRLRTEVVVRANFTGDVAIRYLNPKTGTQVQDVAILHMLSGKKEIRLPGDPRDYIVEVIFPDDFLSPTISGGESRLRLFPREWRRLCTLNVHGIENR